MQLGWIEAAIRYAGRFHAAEKRAYREIFGLSEPSVSRRQARFVDVFERACGHKVFARSVAGRLQGGALCLKNDVVLPRQHVFARVPRAERWLEDALGQVRYQAFEITRADPDPDVLRAIVRAIQDKRSLGITYHSRRERSQRSISPHVIVKVAGRMHVRGWDHARNDYMDFVITRISQTFNVDDAFVVRSHDKEWSNFADLIIEDLMGQQSAVREGIRRDFGLGNDGRRTLRVRKAITPYLVDDIDDGFESPVRIYEKSYTPR